jgi:murein DD-endopeptidase MepM/ murein hydrolase activator NlpD
MPSSDAVSTDGEYRFSRSLKTKEFEEQKRLKPYSSHSERASTSHGRRSDERIQPDPDHPADNSFPSAYGRTASFDSNHIESRFSQRSSQSSYDSARDADYSSHAAAYSQVAVNQAPVSSGIAVDASVINRVRHQIQQFLSDQVTPIRLASHLAVLAVAAVVLIVSKAELPDWQFSLRNLPEEGLFAPQELQGISLEGSNPLAGANSDAAEAFQRAVVPFTQIQQPVEVAEVAVQSQPQSVAAISQSSPANTARDEIEAYVVKPGDTVLGIAARYSLKPETIQWANPQLEANPDLLRIGDRLVILPVNGVLHVVQPGDTLSTISARYKVTTQSIVDSPLNKLESINTPIAIGTQLVIPDGTKPYIPRQVATYSGPKPQTASKGSGALAWPTSGVITQPFWNGHRAIDIGARTGTPVTSADSGYVIASRSGGWNGGYGNSVTIDHGNGYVTLYAHLNSIFVRQGENVTKGQQIGTVGNTGNSTGPHLHFEVRYQGVPRNPFTYLP